jgi:hypothetical protein
MRCGILLSVRSVFLVFAVTFSIPAMAASPQLTVSNDTVTIEGVTPGSSVVLFSVAREPVHYLAQVVSRREVLTDDDHDGKIEYKPSKGVAFQSIWIAVDFQSGETAVAGKPGYIPLPMTQRGAGRGNVLNLVGTNVLDIGRGDVEVLVVRPGKGAWAITVRGGHGTEESPQPWRSRVGLGKLHPLRAEFKDPPPVLVPGDVVLMIDPQGMEYSLTTITPGGH